MGGVASTSFWRWKIIKYKFAMLPGHLLWERQKDTNIIPPLSSCKEIYFFYSSQYFCTEVVGICFVLSDFFMETVPERCRCTNRMKSTKLSFELKSSLCVQMFAIKRAQRRVRKPLINSSPAEWDNCRSLRQVNLLSGITVDR